MPLPIIADVVRVAMTGTLSNGHHFANILHFRNDTAGSMAAAIATLDTRLAAHVTTASGGGTAWRTFASTAATWDEFQYTPLDGSSATTVISHPIAGLAGGQDLPNQVALVVSLRTAVRGRRARGRVYQTPFNEVNNDAPGIPNAGAVSGVQLQWEDLRGDLVALQIPLVVASYVGVSAEDVTTVTVNSRWDTQRRRLD